MDKLGKRITKYLDKRGVPVTLVELEEELWANTRQQIIDELILLAIESRVKLTGSPQGQEVDDGTKRYKKRCGTKVNETTLL